MWGIGQVAVGQASGVRPRGYRHYGGVILVVFAPQVWRADKVTRGTARDAVEPFEPRLNRSNCHLSTDAALSRQSKALNRGASHATPNSARSHIAPEAGYARSPLSHRRGRGLVAANRKLRMLMRKTQQARATLRHQGVDLPDWSTRGCRQARASTVVVAPFSVVSESTGRAGGVLRCW